MVVLFRRRNTPTTLYWIRILSLKRRLNLAKTHNQVNMSVIFQIIIFSALINSVWGSLLYQIYLIFMAVSYIKYTVLDIYGSLLYQTYLLINVHLWPWWKMMSLMAFIICEISTIIPIVRYLTLQDSITFHCLMELCNATWPKYTE